MFTTEEGNLIISSCVISSFQLFVNKANDWLIKTNMFPIDEFIFIGGTNWRRNNWMLITHVNES